MKPPILGRLPPPVKALQSVCVNVPVCSMCVLHTGGLNELVCLHSWYKTRGRLSRMNNSSVITHVSL